MVEAVVGEHVADAVESLRGIAAHGAEPFRQFQRAADTGCLVLPAQLAEEAGSHVFGRPSASDADVAGLQ